MIMNYSAGLGSAVHLRRRRESVTALEVLVWLKARGLEASARDIEWALKEITA